MRVDHYLKADGTDPFQKDLDAMKDLRAVSKIERCIDRMELGNLGNHRSCGEGVCETKIDYGPGYRVYYSQFGDNVLLLFCSGEKSSQEQDIKRAKGYREDFLQRSRKEKRNGQTHTKP